MSVCVRFCDQTGPIRLLFRGKVRNGHQIRPKAAVSTVSNRQHYHFFPSTRVRVGAERSTPSRQRTLTATIPLGAILCENDPSVRHGWSPLGGGYNARLRSKHKGE